MKKHKILHIITGLGTGGAEIMLYKLLSKMNRDVFEAEVISITDIGPVGEKIQSLGVNVRALEITRCGAPNPFVIFKLIKWLRQSRPDIIQTWMYHANLIGSITAWLAGNIPVVWGIHHTDLDPQGIKRSTIWIAKICAKLSHFLPNLIICCSNATQKIHASLGYDNRKMIVIPNGFDLDAFAPNPDFRTSVRHELRIPENVILIGLVARFHLQKDHHNFVQAAVKLHKYLPDVHFLLCGDNVDKKNKKLTDWINKAGLDKYFYLLGRRDDIPRLLSSLDIFSLSSSFGEAFPLVVGEAMACEIPCVVTNVGDSALIVGDTGRVVPPKNPKALAMAWKYLIETGSKKRLLLGKAARARIRNNFSIENIAMRYTNQYRKIIKQHFDTI